jgi:hypothetical protein
VIQSRALGTILFAVLAPPLAHAQVNIDQDKTPAHIWESDCGVCHKTVRGLANGRGNSALTEFLAEHYTSNQQEAAALAAYVLAGGGGTGTPAPVRDDNAGPDHATAAVEEPKPHEARRPIKPEEEPAAAGVKPLRRQTERGKPAKQERTATAEPGPVHGERKLPVDRRKLGTAVPAQHGRLKPAETPQPAEAPPNSEPAQVAVAPKPAAPSKPDVSPPVPTPSAPPQSPPTEASPASRDNIPD